MTSAPRILLYADVNLNIIDGSSVWAASVADTFASANASVTMLSKQAIHSYHVVADLIDRPNITLVDPVDSGYIQPDARLDPSDAATTMAKLDELDHYDAIIVRGSAISLAAVTAGLAPDRLWIYLTDIPQSVFSLTPSAAESIAKIAAGASRLLCQTSELRGFLEQAIPEANNKTRLFPPIVPDEAFGPSYQPLDEVDLSIVYGGKFAPKWNTYEMCSIPGDLRRMGISARLRMIGSKVQDDPDHPKYRQHMTRALESSFGVDWLGGMSRLDTLERIRSCHVALGWRSPELDSSLELSTKLLEYGACNVPAILNRTPMHERLLGIDYPLFATDYGSVLHLLEGIVNSPNIRHIASSRLAQAAANYSRKSAVKRIESLLNEQQKHPTHSGSGGRRLKVLVAGHDLKFISPIVEWLENNTATKVLVDQWDKALARGSSEPSIDRDAAASADVIFCEWMLRNAVWYSANKRPHQRLIVRFHRFELTTEYPSKVDLSAVDKFIFVGIGTARQVIKKIGIPENRSVVIPNAVDHIKFDRPKKIGNEYAIGIVGVLPQLKRLDLAIDLIRLLRHRDSRYRLIIKSAAPWELPWLWNRENAHDYYTKLMADITSDSELRDAVLFDAAGADVAEWFTKIGWILSTSDLESFHLAVVEGMSSGAVPVIRAWDGSREIYAGSWVHDDVASMAQFISTNNDTESRLSLGKQAQNEAHAFDVSIVGAAIAEELTPSTEPVRIDRGLL